MAAIVKPIEAKAVHLIQSGQVIVDLCSVVKELVENALDAEANTIEVRFRNNGLDEIEVQDNGTGISSANYEAIGLKHHTSKLSTYDDLTSLSTFGFRGEALSSLCALSNLALVTAQAHEAPKGNRLEFESSGKLRFTSVVACQKGTTASVSDLFQNLPVRRKELAKNIKREYGKVIGLLHAYACISTSVKFTVKNIVPRSKSMTVFATKANATSRENIANVYGAKTLAALAQLDLSLDLESTSTVRSESDPNKVKVSGHISRPVFGEGRQTPDRQMFFVNGRPCGLPQIAKAINEVYRSFNVSQSPFILADFQMDTTAYDVNVSPDKRSIFLHNAAKLIDMLKIELTAMFNEQDQTVPHSKLETPKLPPFKQLSLSRTDSVESRTSTSSYPLEYSVEHSLSKPGYEEPMSSPLQHRPNGLLQDHFHEVASTREDPQEESRKAQKQKELLSERQSTKIARDVVRAAAREGEVDKDGDMEQASRASSTNDENTTLDQVHIHVRDFNARMAEQKSFRAEQDSQNASSDLEPESSSPQQLLTNPIIGTVPNAFNRMRPKRPQPEVATITIGDKTVTRIIGSQSVRGENNTFPTVTSYGTNRTRDKLVPNQFSQRIGQFAAFGTQVRADLERIESDDDGASPSDFQEHDEAVHEPEMLHATDQRASEIGEDPDNELALESDLLEADTVDDEERKKEEARVAGLISMAEVAASKAEKEQQKRVAQAMRGGQSRDLTVGLQVTLDLPMKSFINQIGILARAKRKDDHSSVEQTQDDQCHSEEERLSLTVSKSDFADMHIVGQFNLGFILAVRHGQHRTEDQDTATNDRDELFIIDQHASDEKFNFERLQAVTVVGSQRMVRPVTLDLTAVEEEIIIDNDEALEKNGFTVEVDTSGDRMVGQRCRLVSLPMSKEVAFSTKDLDELIHLLSETPMLSDSSFVPRPTKVRKMFAMRACRSSIMIGKTLSKKQMSTILQHMGSIDKPWNCPHGRPTMRHLASLDSLDAILWTEGQGISTGSGTGSTSTASDVWKNYAE